MRSVRASPTPIEQGVFCIPLVAFRLLGRRIRRRQGTYRRAFLASTRAAQIAEHIYMKRGHAYADEEEDEGEASLFNGLPSSGAAPMSDVDAHPPFECIPAVVPHPLVAISEISVGLMKEGSMHARCGTLWRTAKTRNAPPTHTSLKKPTQCRQQGGGRLARGPLGAQREHRRLVKTQVRTGRQTHLPSLQSTDNTMSWYFTVFTPPPER